MLATHDYSLLDDLEVIYQASRSRSVPKEYSMTIQDHLFCRLLQHGFGFIIRINLGASTIKEL